MINFRYHVVSLTAVFLALAVGMVLGTAALNGPVTEDLYSEAQSLRKSNGQLRDQIAGMEDELASRDAYVKEAAPLLLDNKLAGQKVVVVAMPGADPDSVAAVVEYLKLANAGVTGTVRFTDRFVAPGSREDARDLATRLLPPTVTEVPADADGVTASAALLAAVLLQHQPAVAATDRTAVLTGYQSEKLIELDGKVTEPATGVIMVSNLPVTESDAAERNAAVVTTIGQFGKPGTAVVAAPGTGGEGNAVAAVREDPTLTKSVSTVDNVNTSVGQLSAVLALVQRVVDRRVGHYGISDAADGRIPKPAA
ncbi:MAG: copper transporter [Micromonosporaceae bacterium]